MDWYCVQADITPAREGNATTPTPTTAYAFTKTARLHAPDGPTVTTPTVGMVLGEGVIHVYRPGLLDGVPFQTFLVRHLTPELLVLTGEDDPSLYVYARDPARFEADAAGRHRLAEELTAWGYVAEYKEPRRSFDPRVCRDPDEGNTPTPTSTP